MTLLTDSEIADLALGVVVANTPASLFSWLVRHNAVRGIASRNTVDELIDCLTEQLRTIERTEVVLAIAYAYFVALIIVFRNEGRIDQLPVDPTLLPWGSAMVERARASEAGTTTTLIETPRVGRIIEAGGNRPAKPLIVATQNLRKITER